MLNNIKPNEKVFEKWRGAGFEAETWRLVIIAPLVETAWADGFLQAAEKREILTRAGFFGITRGDADEKLLADWLEHRPPDEVFNAVREILSEFLESLPAGKRRTISDFILKNCLEIARSSGGIGIIRQNRRAICRAEESRLNELTGILQINRTVV